MLRSGSLHGNVALPVCQGAKIGRDSVGEQQSRQQGAAAGLSSLSYYFRIFFPHPNLVPTVMRTLLRPPSNKFEKKS